MKSNRAAAAAGALWVLAGCNLAPHYERPSMAVTDKYKEAVHGGDAADGWQLAAPRDAEIGGHWWALYQDPQLNELEERVAISNQTVIAAEANYRAAQAMVLEAQAAWFPTLNLSPAVTRSRSSATVNTLGGTTVVGTSTGGTGTGAGTGTGTGTGAGAGTTGTTTTGSTATGGTVAGSTAPRTIYSLPLEASYQVDLWGAIRNNVAQKRYAAEASAAQLAGALLSTQSTLAQDYFQLRVADEQRRILDTTLADYRASLHLVRTLFNNGLTSDEDLAQADTQLESAMAQATDIGIARAQYEHAIAVLIGVPPAKFSLKYRRLDQVLPTVPVGLPADLIERRPDIAAAERQVAAANAAIGVARAAYFPSLTLSGTAGFESTSLSKLLDWPNRFWSFGPQLTETLFDGGARRAATAEARALDDQAAANYRQTVLSALQAVEDNLASLRILAQEMAQQHRAAVAAQRAVELSVVRFRNGVDSYVNVITAQNAFLTAREAELQVQLRQLTAGVNLINNLGGGWSASELRRGAAAGGHAPAGDADGEVPADDAGPGIPNPPALPDRDIRPEDLLKQNADAMSAHPAADNPK